jgi:alanyl-tRNA synthetase
VTRRLYYEDPNQTRFYGRLLRLETLELGGRPRTAAVLEATAFYPEGGGQPADRGTLADAEVQDVQDRDGEVLHFLSRELEAAPGDLVSGEVDEERRADFRRQHTGQHLLSAALQAAAGARTVSANLGEELTTVEVDLPALGAEALEAAEELANRFVNANHPVVVHWVSPQEAARFPLRKPPPAGLERLRIVEVPGVDASACGGLHVSSTGEVGLIRYAGQEKIRGRVRLQWKIGGRAWRELRAREGVLGELARELTCGVSDLPGSVRALKAGLKAQEQAAALLEGRLAELLAERLRHEADVNEKTAAAADASLGGPRLICRLLEGPGLLPRLFQALTGAPGTVVCLGAPAGDGLSWMLGWSEDLELPLGGRLPELLAPIQGKGGGRGRRWQGSARRPEGWPELCAALAAALTSLGRAD